MQRYDVIIVGAGPAGVGLATMLAKLPDLDYTLLEGRRIGESLRRWPAQTRFITPSFYSNPFGLADLNAVDALSSPALHCGVEHPSGAQYADYLSFITQQHELPIREGWQVQQVASAADGGFIVSGDQGELHTRFLVWATGEYQFPAIGALLGHFAPAPGQWLGDNVDATLLTMTIAARNAPLMLAVTVVALPGQPLIYAALVMGTLVEFPHLTLLRRVLLALRRRRIAKGGAIDSLS